MSTSERSEDKQEPPAENEAGPSGQSAPAEKSRETKGGEPHVQNNRVFESDEDIPGDFFDDFLKEDFMAGLDIVDDDEWDEDKIKSDKNTSEKSKKDAKPQTDSVSKRKRQKVPGKTSNGNKKSLDDKEKSKQRKKKREEKSEDSKHKKNVDKPIDADEFDIRRDPEKTKRDIARDKVRCEKDKEMKIISEKLSLVETGLVPPGTEMEIDIEEIKKQKEKIGNSSPRDLREHIKDLKGKNRSPGRKAKSPKRRSLPRRSPNLARKLSPLRRRSRSPRKDTITSARPLVSLVRRSPRRSPVRLSPRRLSPLRLRSPLRRFGRRRSRSPSPLFRNRRNKFSPARRWDRSHSRESDREKWLKHRNRSRSPRRKREDAKKSFLQEIAEKLNEIRHPINMMPQLQPMQPMQPILQPMQPTLRYVEPQPIPVPPVPAPVPAPNNVPVFPNPQQPQFDPYDQSFFIGVPQAAALNNFPGQPHPSPLPAGPQIPLNVQPINPSLVQPNNLGPNSSNIGLSLVDQNQLKQMPENQEDISKLFQDKQIRLSEFLAITAKPEVFSSSPVHLQEKIKVITRCHDAIKILESCEKKYSGRLVVHKTDKYKVKIGKNRSPLKCLPPVQFPFTDLAAPAEEQKSSFTKFINDLLLKLGLLQDTVVIMDDEKPPPPPLPQTDMPDFAPPPPPFISPKKKTIKNNINVIRQEFLQTNRFSKMVQTDVFKCEDCEKRKKILYRSTTMQTNTSSATFSVSTQVTEEDFQPKFPKTQSLAALTPAQLLAKSRESLNAATRSSRMDVDNFDVHQTGYNRSNFFRPPDSYRGTPPFVNALSVYDTVDSQMYEGGGRGREPYPPRALDPNIRFSHNNYY